MKRNEEQQLQIEAKDLRLWLLHRKNMRVAFRIVGASLAGTVIAPDSAPRSMTIFIMNHCTLNMIRGNMTSSAAGHNLLFLRSSRSPLLHMSQEFPCRLQPGQDFPSPTQAATHSHASGTLCPCWHMCKEPHSHITLKEEMPNRFSIRAATQPARWRSAQDGPVDGREIFPI